MRASLELSGATFKEAAPWDVDAFAVDGCVGVLEGEALEAWNRYTVRLLEQRTLAVSDLKGLRVFCLFLPSLRKAARAGDQEAAQEIRLSMVNLGLLEGDRIEPFRGDRPTLAEVLPFEQAGREQSCGG